MWPNHSHQCQTGAGSQAVKFQGINLAVFPKTMSITSNVTQGQTMGKERSLGDTASSQHPLRALAAQKSLFPPL